MRIRLTHQPQEGPLCQAQEKNEESLNDVSSGDLKYAKRMAPDKP